VRALPVWRAGPVSLQAEDHTRRCTMRQQQDAFAIPTATNPERCQLRGDATKALVRASINAKYNDKAAAGTLERQTRGGTG